MEIAVLRHFNKITDSMVQKTREQLLDTSKEDILRCADLFNELNKKSACVTIGSYHIIKNEENFYDKMRNFTAGDEN